jgi:hypothetical protein
VQVQVQERARALERHLHRSFFALSSNSARIAHPAISCA